MKSFEIAVLETFPRLSHAPVAEAALEIRARAAEGWSEDAISPALQAQLPDYPSQGPHQAYAGSFEIKAGVEPKLAAEDLGWCGVAATSGDGKQIAFFERDRFLFSRLEPYPGWDDFRAEANRLWNVHRSLARPLELQRIGLRFINRMTLPTQDLNFEDYLFAAPKEPEGLPLPFSGFLHRDVLSVPGHAYGILITRAIQPADVANAANITLIIDVDVFSTEPVPLEDANLEKRLSEMRWLKNKAFFGSITRQTKARLQ